MKLIEPKVEYLPQEKGLQGMYKQIEIAGRTCYQSQDKITEDSAKTFAEMLIKNGHGAMLEHATVYLAIPVGEQFGNYANNPYSICNMGYYTSNNLIIPITTNYRVLLQGDYDSWDDAMDNNFNKNWLDDLKYLCEPTEYHEKRYTFRFTTNIGISREFNRHRVNSMGEESSRFCGYNKDKFGSEITYIQPRQFTQKDIDDNMYGKSNMDTLMALCQMICIREDLGFQDVDYWIFAMLASEFSYMGLISCGWKPQDARSVLNLNTKTELVHTAFESDWKHFCKLRCSPAAHPEAQVLANQIKDILKFNLL